MTVSMRVGSFKNSHNDLCEAKPAVGSLDIFITVKGKIERERKFKMD